MKMKAPIVAAIAGLTLLGASPLAAAQDQPTNVDGSPCSQILTVMHTVNVQDSMAVAMVGNNGAVLGSPAYAPQGQDSAALCLDAFPSTTNVRIHVMYGNADQYSELMPASAASGLWYDNGSQIVKTVDQPG